MDSDDLFDGRDATRPMPRFEPVPHSPGMSLEEQMMAVEAAKIARYMQFAQPALNSLIPAFDRVERNVNQLVQRVDILERSTRRSFALLLFGNALVIAYFLVTFRVWPRG